MRLFIPGATGHTGVQTIDLAIARSHAVAAFVRSPERIMTLCSLLRAYDARMDNRLGVRRRL